MDALGAVVASVVVAVDRALAAVGVNAYQLLVALGVLSLYPALVRVCTVRTVRAYAHRLMYSDTRTRTHTGGPVCNVGHAQQPAGYLSARAALPARRLALLPPDHQRQPVLSDTWSGAGGPLGGVGGA
jgi:hypothetical protein